MEDELICVSCNKAQATKIMQFNVLSERWSGQIALCTTCLLMFNLCVKLGMLRELMETVTIEEAKEATLSIKDIMKKELYPVPKNIRDN